MARQKRASPARCGDSDEARTTDQLGGPVSSQNSVSDSRLQVVVSPTASGRKWRATLDGYALCVSASPFIKSARILIAKGFDPNCTIEMWRPRTDAWSLRGKLGAVAATVIDGETASRRAKNGALVRFPDKAVSTPAGGAR